MVQRAIKRLSLNTEHDDDDDDDNVKRAILFVNLDVFL